MDNKWVKIGVGAVCGIAIILAVAFGISYGIWVSRGDQIAFSSSGSFGLGDTPLRDKNSAGAMISYGTIHNFLFVRDTAVNRKALGSFH